MVGPVFTLVLTNAIEPLSHVLVILCTSSSLFKFSNRMLSPIFNHFALQAALLWQVRVAVGLGFVLVLSVLLMLILGAAGDSAAASALRGLTWLLLAGLICDGFALVVTTALAVIRLLEDRKSGTDKPLDESLRS